MELVLNKKRTFLIGFAFFTILMLWQIYNYYAPLFLKELLTNNYGANDYNYLIGIIMALDNILALFMLPLFGTLSDKTATRIGKRMPYIIVGTTLSFMAFPFIPFLFIKNSLWGVIALMGIILISMNVYRAPSVALMPDVTPKPLRSKANAIINFVGYVGAIVGSLLTMVFTKTNGAGQFIQKDFLLYPFIITSVLMIFALVVMVLRIKENALAESLKEEMLLGEEQSETLERVEDNKPLSKGDKTNLWLLLISVFLWYFAFNAVETFGSTYAREVLGNASGWGIATSILAVASLITFLPSDMLTKKIGRKKTIIVGLLVMIISLSLAFFVNEIGIMLFVLFAFAGVGWALINVNSYPMFVELASSKNVGKFTGYYYVASQIAQSITPIIIGFVLDWVGLRAYFPYATIFMALALVMFMFIKTKNSKPVSDDKQTEVVANKSHKQQ